jgi:dihydroorotate dehydrogenase electron transfer subunit
LSTGSTSRNSRGSTTPGPIRADAEVLANVAEGPNTYRLVLGVEDWPGAEPGQFVMLSPGARQSAERTDPLLPRPMAVYRGHEPGAGASGVEVLYRASGRGTQLMADMLPGQRMRIVGPLGEPFPVIEPATQAILVGGGTGIASLYELAVRAKQAGSAGVSVILGARTRGDLMGLSDFAALGVDLYVTTEDGSEGQPGRVTDALPELLAKSSGQADTTVYACGPTPMMRACAELAHASGARCIVSLENNMACGFGVCLGCAVPVTSGAFSLVCRAGPVYDAADVEWSGLP